MFVSRPATCASLAISWRKKSWAQSVKLELKLQALAHLHFAPIGWLNLPHFDQLGDNPVKERGKTG